MPDLTGRTFAVTGGNAGIGYFITEYLAAAGAEVVILGRHCLPRNGATPVTSRTAAQWTVAASGALALAMGVAGILAPDRQTALMGFEGNEAASPLLTVSSLAAVNTGLLYLLGTAKGWAGFPAFTVRARLLMGGGLLALAASGRGPKAFNGGAAWEIVSAGITAAAIGWERRRAKRG